MQFRLSLFNILINGKNTRNKKDMERDIDKVANIYARCTSRREKIIKESKKQIIEDKS